MNQYPFPKKSWTGSVFGLFLFAMLLLARDTLITSVKLGFYKSQFLMLALIGLLFVIFLVYNRRNLRAIVADRRMLVMAVFAAILLLPMLVKRDWQIMYLSILLCLLFPVFLTYFTDYCTVARYYVGILTALSAYSVIATYLFRQLVWAGVLQVPVCVNDAGMEFYDFLLCFGVTDPFWHRNFGIFREPGVYQFFLLLGLYLNHYAVSWRKETTRWLVSALLVITMFTTYAIGGFIETGLFAVFVYFEKKYYRGKLGRWLGVSVIVAMVAAVGFLLIRMRMPGFAASPLYELYDMFIRLTTDSESLVDRFSAIFTDVKFFVKNPLTGAKIAPVLHGTNHNTSSTLVLYAILGFFGGTLHIATWVALLWKKERNVIANLILLGIFLMSFNTQNLTADVFFWLFPCMALIQRGLPFLKLPMKGEKTDGKGIAS